MQSMTMLSSQQLRPPRLSFDYAIRTQTSESAFDGFRRWGPYDKNQPRTKSIKCAVLYPIWATEEMRKLREAFLRGMHFFKGFQQFSHGISISSFDEIPLTTNSTMSFAQQAQVYQDAISSIGNNPGWDIVFALIPLSPRYVLDAPYYVAKLRLAALGLPCQLLAISKVQNDETFKWSLSNIALQVYSKLGNIPWVVESSNNPSDLIIGIGQRQVRNGRIGSIKRFMGFTTAYKNNGAFLTFQGIAAAGTYEDYLEKLSQSVSAALSAYRTAQSKRGLPLVDPNRIVLHSFKKVGKEEIEALEKGIKSGSQTGNIIEYALVHIDGTGNFLVFDQDHKTFLPKSGYSISLGPLQGLLLSEGQERYEHRKLGFPTPLAVHLDSRSLLTTTEPIKAFPALFEQVYALSKVNWRGFNAAAIPVTLSYSRLVADLVSSCADPELWTILADAGNLRDKPWFL